MIEGRDTGFINQQLVAKLDGRTQESIKSMRKKLLWEKAVTHNNSSSSSDDKEFCETISRNSEVATSSEDDHFCSPPVSP